MIGNRSTDELLTFSIFQGIKVPHQQQNLLQDVADAI